MATTSIDGSRGRTAGAGVALERYTDAALVRDGKKFYLGDDGDVAFSWDNTNAVMKIAGYPVGISDVDPGVSDAIFLVSDTTSGKYLLAISAG